MKDKCFACDRRFRTLKRWFAVTSDSQVVFVGFDCYRHIVKSGKAGYQPALGGPRLWTMDTAPNGDYRTQPGPHNDYKK